MTQEKKNELAHKTIISHLPITLRVDEDNIMSSVVVSRVNQHRVQGVVSWRLRLLLKIRVQVDVFVELEPIGVT